MGFLWLLSTKAIKPVAPVARKATMVAPRNILLVRLRQALVQSLNPVPDRQIRRALQVRLAADVRGKDFGW